LLELRRELKEKMGKRFYNFLKILELNDDVKELKMRLHQIRDMTYSS